MPYRFRSKKDISSVEELEKSSKELCGTTINLQRMPIRLFDKLFDIVKAVVLTKLTLRECFSQEDYLVLIFQALGQNQRIKELHLDVRENKFDHRCTSGLTKLITRGIFKSLELPEGLDGSDCEDIFRELLRCDSKIEVLNVSGSILTETSIDCIVELIRGRVITQQLVMKKCNAPAGRMLTDKDREKLQDAEKATRKWFGKKKMLTIFWFDFVEHADVDLDDLNPNDWEIVQLPPPPNYISEVAGGLGKTVHFMIKSKIQKSGAWKLANGRRRRRQEETTSKVRIQHAEVDELSKIFQQHTLDYGEVRSEHGHVHETSAATAAASPSTLPSVSDNQARGQGYKFPSPTTRSRLASNNSFHSSPGKASVDLGGRLELEPQMVAAAEVTQSTEDESCPFDRTENFDEMDSHWQMKGAEVNQRAETELIPIFYRRRNIMQDYANDYSLEIGDRGSNLSETDGLHPLTAAAAKFRRARRRVKLLKKNTNLSEMNPHLKMTAAEVTKQSESEPSPMFHRTNLSETSLQPQMEVAAQIVRTEDTSRTFLETANLSEMDPRWHIKDGAVIEKTESESTSMLHSTNIRETNLQPRMEITAQIQIIGDTLRTFPQAVEGIEKEQTFPVSIESASCYNDLRLPRTSIKKKDKAVTYAIYQKRKTLSIVFWNIQEIDVDEQIENFVQDDHAFILRSELKISEDDPTITVSLEIAEPVRKSILSAGSQHKLDFDVTPSLIIICVIPDEVSDENDLKFNYILNEDTGSFCIN